jgi:HK97 family phage prohead protease
MKAMEHRKITSQFEVREEDKGKTLVGYAAVFDSRAELYPGFFEVIATGAFDEVLDDDVRALIDHESAKILGRSSAGTLRVSTDEKGLKYEIDLPDTTYANDLAISMKRGDIRESSFGFTVKEDSVVEEMRDGKPTILRTIKKIEKLYDVSPVTFPAYKDTEAQLRKEVEHLIPETGTPHLNVCNLKLRMITNSL